MQLLHIVLHITLPNMYDCVGYSCDYFMMSGHTRFWSEILTNLQQESGDGRLVQKCCFYYKYSYSLIGAGMFSELFTSKMFTF